MNQCIRSTRTIRNKGSRRPLNTLRDADSTLGGRREPGCRLIWAHLLLAISPELAEFAFGEFPPAKNFADRHANALGVSSARRTYAQASIFKRLLDCSQSEMSKTIGSFDEARRKHLLSPEIICLAGYLA